MSRRYTFVTLMFALACGGDDKASEPVCPTLDNLESGIMDGTLDGAAWTTSGTTWAWTGDSLQLGTPATDGWLLSVVLQDSVNGETARAAVEGELPATFTLKTGAEGGWAVLYPDTGDSFSTQDTAGGSLSVTAYDAAAEGCLDFTASDGDTTVALSGGRFRAEPR